jgi:hypothetical protein
MASFSFRGAVRGAVRFWSAALFGSLLVLSLAGCSSSKGQACDTCTTDDECAPNGLLCVPFSDGSKHCGSGMGSTQCRKPLL